MGDALDHQVRSIGLTILIETQFGERIMAHNKHIFSSVAFIFSIMVLGCSSTDNNSDNKEEEVETDIDPARPDPTVTDPGAEPGTNSPVSNDSPCPEGLRCQDMSDGQLACLQSDGSKAPGSATQCHKSDGGCSGNASCVFVDESGTNSICTENCGECRTGTTCVVVTDDGYMGCLESGSIPSGAKTGCHETGGCEGNTTCFYTNSENTASVCIDNCSRCQPGTCGAGMVCDGGICVPEPCTEGSCSDGEVCYDGRCIPDLGPGPGTNPGIDCNLPQLQCDPSTANCAELIQFDPTKGDGYIDYPENGETVANQYRSWLRRDTVMLIKYAAAKVACLAKTWTFGNGGPIGLIDMSEKDGAIPGTSEGQPGHPDGTHVNGRDIDIAYYQVNTRNNAARPICDHTAGGAEQYHCTAPPHLLDPWRTALFIGATYEHPRLRVIGCDGKAGPLIEMAIDKLCEGGWLTGKSCTTKKLAYEIEDQGHGWYRFHHHHIHVSFSGTAGTAFLPQSQSRCLIEGSCARAPIDAFLRTQTQPKFLPVPGMVRSR
jgi:hypothetical protein